MPFNVNEFKSRIGGSLASPAYFRVLFTGAIVDPDGVNLLSLLCNSAQLPSRIISTNEYTTHGPTIKLPYNSIYDDIVLGLYCTESMEVKQLFGDWMNFVHDTNSTNEFSYFDDYTSDIIIEQMNAAGDVIYSCKLIDAYPTMVAALDLNWSSTNAFHNLQVTISFRSWREEPLSVNPFGNFLRVNSLYPNFDISGALEQTGTALFSKVDGQFMSKVQQGIRFSKDVGRGSKSAAQHES
jgi:hypothetical protein